MIEKKSYSLYKGLQRPLVFKVFRGKFIYWAMGSVLAGIVCGGLIGAFVNQIVGFLSMLGISVPLLMYTLNKQKHGLYNKRKDFMIFIFSPKHHPRSLQFPRSK
jgi:putative exporter of polyketide antibiotics